jgi:hypothetical protein
VNVFSYILSDSKEAFEYGQVCSTDEGCTLLQVVVLQIFGGEAKFPAAIINFGYYIVNPYDSSP